MAHESIRGRVVVTTGTWNTVYGEDGKFYECSVRGKFKVQEGLNATNPIAVGDVVQFEMKSTGDRGVIFDIEDRKNYLVRQSPKKPSKVHVIATNLDQALVVFTLDYPRVKQGFIDRFLVTAEAYDIKPLIIINKNDLYDEKLSQKRDHLVSLYRSLGYAVFCVSAETGYQLPGLKQQLEGQVSLITGPSGVGKSSLMNALYEDLHIKTATVSKATHKGKHITTFPRMYPLPNNTFVIDTPGIKEFGLVGFELYEISHFFPEMEAYLDDCKFNNCLHINEPGCAVKAAVEEEGINQERYESYKRIVESLDN